jgi:homoserine O-acetyltransferase
MTTCEAILPSYEITGRADGPVILALGGISATRHVVQQSRDDAPGWWAGVFGRGYAIDPERYRVLSADFRDGGVDAGGRPASTITTHDQAEAIVAILDDLGIERLDAAVGASYGGMVVLALAERFPDRVREAVVISAAHETHPYSTGLRAIQRRIVELGLATGRNEEGMILGRAIAMTTYRTAQEFGERFSPAPDVNGDFEVERYLIRAGEKFAARMAPHRFLSLSLSADLHRVIPERITASTTVIAAEGDSLVPVELLEAMAARLPNLRAYHVLRTRCGHDAFLTEPEQLGAILTSTLGSLS